MRVIPGLCAFALIPPWMPGSVSMIWDGTWTSALSMAAVAHHIFGREIAFTFGPLGFLYSGIYFPGTFLTLVLGWLAITGAFVAGVESLRSRTRFSPGARCLWELAIVAFVALFSSDVAFFTLALVFLACSIVRPRTPASMRALLVVALAIASLVKFTFLIAAVSVLLAAALEDVLERRIPWPLAMFAVAVPAAWALVGQPLGAIPIFLSRSIAFSRAYSSAMQKGGPLSLEGPLSEILDFAIPAVLLLGLLVRATARESRARAFTVALATTALTFVFAKASYVRHVSMAV